MTGRSFLFLQGPPGPFFKELAHGLRLAGHRCHRINLNGGDWLDWSGPADNFSGTPDDWPAYLDRVIAREAITDIVLYGDCRSYHRIARESATGRIAVHVFEEGYIRPDWVTLEPGGVNGNSGLPRHPDAYLSLAANLPPVQTYPDVPSSFVRRAREALAYFLASWALAPRYRGYRSHRPYASAAELSGWMRRMALRPLARLRSARAVEELGDRRFFLLPLQLDSDHQIRIHSPFEGMREALTAVFASFAAHAPTGTVLLVKEHPLDNGLHRWRRMVRELAGEYEIGGRVLFIEHGDLYSLVAAASGVVTVNSTTGTLALSSRVPVIVLGHAVYDLPGVTHQDGLDEFWSDPVPPQLEIYEAFRRVLVARCLLRGGFSNIAGRSLLLPAAVARLGVDRGEMQLGVTDDARASA